MNFKKKLLEQQYIDLEYWQNRKKEVENDLEGSEMMTGSYVENLRELYCECDAAIQFHKKAAQELQRQINA